MATRTAILIMMASVLLALAGCALLFSATFCRPNMVLSADDRLSDAVGALDELPAGEPFEITATSAQVTTLLAGEIANPDRSPITGLNAEIHAGRLVVEACLRDIWLYHTGVRATLVVQPAHTGDLEIRVEQLRVGRLGLPTPLRDLAAGALEREWRRVGAEYHIAEVELEPDLLRVTGWRR